MEVKQTIGNNVCIKLDPENEFIKTKSGIKLFIDTSFEPEKHIVRVGEVVQTPTTLIQKKGEIPWNTDNEVQIGDRALLYFLAVQNCLAPEKKKYVREEKTIWIFIKYHNIYAVIRDEKIIPVNGYVLVEPVEDPEKIRIREDAKKKGIELVEFKELSKVDVVYGKIAYIGKPNRAYDSPYKSDEHYNLNAGDNVIMKRITDIPVEYEYHAKIDGGRTLYRVQRHQILAKI